MHDHAERSSEHDVTGRGLGGATAHVLVTLANPADPAPGHASTPRDHDMVNLYAAGSAAGGPRNCGIVSVRARVTSAQALLAFEIEPSP